MTGRLSRPLTDAERFSLDKETKQPRSLCSFLTGESCAESWPNQDTLVSRLDWTVT